MESVRIYSMFSKPVENDEILEPVHRIMDSQQ
jgi:hypothetical protein